jgi:hypothetical protein
VRIGYTPAIDDGGKNMSCVPTVVRGLAVAAAALILLAGNGLGADPPAKPAPASVARPAPSCGGLPRGSRAYKDCITAEARRDGAGPPVVTPALSTR